ncbi:MAG: NAD-dependent epimerase/dehydratase family protein [Candidatus Latescibacterota bacterium]|jgi:long-chain acyl-CoA synthetase|nr:MAG: NAD-dependent epimerase/dehydratase family protein [Candidatus Latescibacterota bacterium]
MSETVFLTGATGYIGASLLGKWLESTGARLVLLARGKRGDDPRKRVMGALSALYPAGGVERFSPRIEVIEGDVSFERLGLDEARYRDLASRVTQIVHCAAAARFDLPLDEARRTNVGGTRNVLDFGRACGGLERIDYVGTAYVAGKRAGLVREDELDLGQEHHNTYERSKMEAEGVVRESMRDLPIAISRPSIVICDSRTGRASSFNGFYRALRMYRLGVLKVLPGNPSTAMDLVPVDYVTEAIFAISRRPASLGVCHHLTAGPRNATRIDEIAELASRHFRMERFAIVPPAEFAAFVSRMEGRLSEKELGMLNEIALYAPYLAGGPEFDGSNAVSATGLEAPPVRSYFEKMARYIEAEERR